MQFRYTLIDYTTSPTTGVSTVVPEPVGWDGLSLKLERDKDYHGFFEYTDDEISGLKFYDKGREILKAAFDDFGIEAVVDLKIEILCLPQSALETLEADADQWMVLFLGRIDFDRTRYSCGLKGCFAEASAAKSTCLMTLRNRFDQSVDLDSNKDFDGNTLDDYAGLGFEMNLPGKNILYAFEASHTLPFSYTYNYVQDLSGGPVNMGLNFNYDDITHATLAQSNNTFSQTFFDNGGETIPDGLPSWLAELPPLIDFRIPYKNLCSSRFAIFLISRGVITIETSALISNFGIYIAALILKASGDIIYLDSTEVRVYDLPVPAGTHTFPFNIASVRSEPLEEGDLIYFQFIIHHLVTTDTTPVPITIQFDELQAKIYNDGVCPDSTADVYLINEALSRTVETVTNDCLRVYSNYFGRTDSLPYNTIDSTNVDGCAGLEVIANGRKIRKAILADGTSPKMFVSFKGLIEGLNAIHCIGYGIEPDTFRGGNSQLLRIEPFEYFYQNDNILTCLIVPNLKSSVLADMFVSKFTSGYKKWEAEQLAGTEDFHGQREYRTNISTISKDLQQVSNLIASGFAIEITRRQAGDNKDWRYDDDIFIICARRGSTAIEVELDVIAPGYNNIYSPQTLYNIAISPIRNAMRWAKRIAQSLLPNWNTDIDGILKFSFGQANYVAETLYTNTTCRIEGVRVNESQNIHQADYEDTNMPIPLMYNIVDEFEYPLSFVDYSAIITSPYGMVEYSCNNGQSFHGFIKSITYKPADGKATFQLIRAFNP